MENVVLVVLPAQAPVRPTSMIAQLPSNRETSPPPSPDDARRAGAARGSDRSRRAGFASRGSEDEPDSDLLSLPRLPPVAPWLHASLPLSVMTSKQVKTTDFMRIRGAVMGGYCLEATQRPEHPSDRWNVPEPVRPERRPWLVTPMPL
jgi:hypothetical protein